VKLKKFLFQHDQVIARQLFVSMFLGIIREISSQKSDNFVMEIKTEFQHIYKQAGQCVPMLSGALMEIALEHDIIKFSPEVISDGMYEK
jgi:hypothetical protein